MGKEKPDMPVVSLKLHRDSKGKIRAIEGLSPLLGFPVEVMPLTYGESRNLLSFGKAIFDWSVEDKITLINEHIVSPEIHIEDEEDLLDNYDAWTIEDLIHAVITLSGLGRFYSSDDEGNVDDGED